MFRKNNFQVKSSTSLGHHVRKDVLPEKINACFNSKQQFSLLKVAFQDGATAKIVMLENKEPMFFQRAEEEQILFPSVYFLWNFPSHFPVLFIQSTVLTYLQKGSNLMIPGILDEFPIPNFEANDPVAIAISSESEQGGQRALALSGPVAVGKALLSSVDITSRVLLGGKGKAVEILHFYGDFLWAFGSKRDFPPFTNTGPVVEEEEEEDRQSATQTSESEEVTSGGLGLTELGIDEDHVEGDATGEGQTETTEPLSESTQTAAASGSMTTGEMDQMLKNTFFSSLRWRLDPHSRMPIDAGQFYANFILKCLPAGKRLEIKKTSFKKFNVFLREMNKSDQGWVVKLKTVKGIDSIEEVNFEHPNVRNAPKPQESAEESVEHGSKTATKVGTTAGVGGTALVSISENMFSLTEQVMPLFRPAGFRKGDLVDFGKIRAVLLDYVKEKNLAKGGEQILLDDTLQIVVQYFLEEQFPVNKVVQRISAAMTKAVVVRAMDGGAQQIVHRVKVPSVELKVEKRCGNKVVTLVNNLAAFGIDAKTLDKAIKGTGTSILNNVAGCDGPQLLIQGNEVNSVGRLLDAFGIPKKFLKGLELGVKEKKSKKK